jgi:hypothetical protein
MNSIILLLQFVLLNACFQNILLLSTDTAFENMQSTNVNAVPHFRKLPAIPQDRRPSRSIQISSRTWQTNSKITNRPGWQIK